jgi:hypothetical protein
MRLLFRVFGHEKEPEVLPISASPLNAVGKVAEVGQGYLLSREI